MFILNLMIMSVMKSKRDEWDTLIKHFEFKIYSKNSQSILNFQFKTQSHAYLVKPCTLSHVTNYKLNFMYSMIQF